METFSAVLFMQNVVSVLFYFILRRLFCALKTAFGECIRSNKHFSPISYSRMMFFHVSYSVGATEYT